MNFKNIALSSKCFRLSIEKRITKKDVLANQGGFIPAISANIQIPFGYVKKPLFDDFSQPSILWGIDGNWATRVVEPEYKFYPTDHCGYLRCSDRRINLHYLAYMLFLEGESAGFSRSFRASLENIKGLSIPFPVTSNGDIDEIAQQNIADRILRLEGLREKLRRQLNRIIDADIEIDKSESGLAEKTKKLYLSDDDFVIMSEGIGKNRKFFRDFQDNQPDFIPVYTAAQTPVAFIPKIANKETIKASPNNPVLSFATNGDGSAGKNFILHKKPFYINSDRIAILCKREKVSLEYIMCVLRNMKTQYGFNHNFKANKKNIKDVEIPIPIDDSGEFDLEKQLCVARRYLNLNSIREKTIDLLARAVNSHVRIVF